ncbi:hypothetical protein DPX16_5144 [Anabarilius grahami]|uniref:Uncharacterized protein n=1 Tax=Anabarilius grahami TaxID=495550 RepID=A0A3N0XL08_ANAGA|nr:hypothetical protein DPX16_5144 [Anabarilius grahami]
MKDASSLLSSATQPSCYSPLLEGSEPLKVLVFMVALEPGAFQSGFTAVGLLDPQSCLQKVISSSSQITDCQSLVFLSVRVLRRRKGGMHRRRWVITLVFLPLMGSDMAPEGQSNQASARSSKRNDHHSCATVTHGASKQRLQSIVGLLAKHVVKVALVLHTGP